MSRKWMNDIVRDTIIHKDTAIKNLQITIATSNEVTFTVVNATSRIDITERASAPSGEDGIGKLWVKNTTPNELWFTNDAGTSFKIY